MARLARDQTPKRRSARLSNNATQQSARKAPISNLQLDAVLEREETPDDTELPSIDNVISTPSTSRNAPERLRELCKITTPKTEPQPEKTQMHPATIHQTTAKAPDSGLKFGFADISTTGRASLASLQNTPSRPRQSLANTNISASFKFKFSHESNMSDDGRKLMDSIREDAARIKEQLRAERELPEQKDAEQFGNAPGRRIAKPTAKAGRYSDIHMAQFKKMDSIENHPSSFRARPGFARPTTQSLKRTSSRADLDEPERPKTAGKSPSTRIPPPVVGRLASTSPFKSVRPSSSHGPEVPTKRMRRNSDEDVSDNKPPALATTLPRPASGRFLASTKASAARASGSSGSPAKPSAIPRSNSVRSVRPISRQSMAAPTSPAKLPAPDLSKPLPPAPEQQVTSPFKQGLTRTQSTKSLAAPPAEAPSSRIPTMAGTMASLKSILRSPKKPTAAATAATPKNSSNIPVPASSQKKVDFTPSVKSRYAVKLAEGSPSPAKLDRSRPMEPWKPAIPYDSSAFIVGNASDDEEEWEDEDSNVAYPSLPNLSPGPRPGSGPVTHTFARKVREHGRRESKEFKSIFTTLHPRPDTASSLTSVNTNVNRTNPIVNASRISVSPQKSQPSQSPSTIRRVPRVSEPVQPFEDEIQTVPHGLPGKKRRMESNAENDRFGKDDDAKENRRVSHMPSVPGGWNEHDSSMAAEQEQEQDEGEKRGGKRARVAKNVKSGSEPEEKVGAGSLVKKPSAAREAAAKSAKDRKVKASIGGGGGGRGFLSLSRLNMLAQPKQQR